MKISKRQHEEIDFLVLHFCTGYNPVSSDIEEYINVTVLGKGSLKEGKFSSNPLLSAKHRLDIMIKIWRRDITIGYLSVHELKADFNHPYFDRIMDSILKSVTRDYRLKTLTDSKDMTCLAFTNFGINPLKMI